MNHPSPHIRNLILRFLRKEISDAELNELESWLQLHQDNADYFDKFNRLYQEQNALETFTGDKVRTAWQTLEQRIKTNDAPARKHVMLQVYQSVYFRAAASICIIALVLWRLFPASVDQPSVAESIVITNSTKRDLAHILPDSTKVWLNANSILEYSPDFLETRRVILKGEAFFDVKKRQKQNFVVKTSHISIEVKGTRFNVEAYDAESEKATLEEGEIELTINGLKETFAMTPGDQITINKKAQTIVRERVDPKNFSAWKEPQLVFDNTTLADIVVKLENRFNVKISIDEALAQRERLSMTIDDETLEEILEMIHLSSTLNYKTENETIVIYE